MRHTIIAMIVVLLGAGCAGNFFSQGGTSKVVIGDPATDRRLKSSEERHRRHEERLDRIEGRSKPTQRPDHEDPPYLQPTVVKPKTRIKWSWKTAAVVTLVTAIVGGSVAVIGYNVKKAADGEF